MCSSERLLCGVLFLAIQSGDWVLAQVKSTSPASTLFPKIWEWSNFPKVARLECQSFFCFFSFDCLRFRHFPFDGIGSTEGDWPTESIFFGSRAARRGRQGQHANRFRELTAIGVLARYKGERASCALHFRTVKNRLCGLALITISADSLLETSDSGAHPVRNPEAFLQVDSV
jgi:hypothetical protein